MSSEQTWVEALNISPESLSEWSSQAPPDMPLLVWCMAEGHVNAEDYLAWACDHFGLAVLDSKFFTESFKRETLEPFRKDEQWSAWRFPVGEWDDCTFVACFEPPADREEGSRYTYVLADPTAMKSAWGEAGDDAKLLAMEAPIGINPNANHTFVLNLDEATLIKPSESVEPNQKTHTEEKTNVTLSVVMDKTSAKVSPVKPAAKADAIKPSPLELEPVENDSTPPPAPAPRTRSGLISAQTVNEESEIATAFSRLHDSYQSSMIMRCVDGFARPYKWDPNLPIAAGDDKFNVNLNYPSFFRIVTKTMHPYHGYVIDSPAHKEFFANLNFDTPPSCVTAIPLKAGEKLWGLLVAFGGQSAQTTDALNQALGVAEKLSTVMGAAWTKAA